MNATTPAIPFNTPAWPVWRGGYGKPIGAVNCLLNGQWHKHMLISIDHDGQRPGFPDGIGRVHAGNGIIHMESDSPKHFTLGDWFTEWGQRWGATAPQGLRGRRR